MLKDVVRQPYVAVQAVFRDFIEGGLGVNVLRRVFFPALNDNVTAADRHNPLASSLIAVLVICKDVHCVLVRQFQLVVCVPYDFAWGGFKAFENSSVSAVTFSGFSKRAVKDYLI